nr:long-chain-fatty-acid--CoA ligase 4-like [Dermacentor andersoni]
MPLLFTVIAFSSLEERGANRELEECSPSPDDVAIVMFTSGSSGTPKGVIVSHRNLVSAMNDFVSMCDQYGAYTSDDVYLAYLPMAHMLELATEMLLLGAGARIGYSFPLTITDSSAVAKGCQRDVTLLQPIILVYLPLIADRLRKGVNEVATSKGPLFQGPNLRRGEYHDADNTRADHVGPPLPCCYMKLVDWDEGNYRTTDKLNSRGEIVVGGPCVAKGYFKNDELMKESFKEEGGIRWFYPGGIAEIFPDGTLRIVDRKKDLVKLQFGEYISLGRVESVLKTCPLVDNLFVYGNSLHTYLVAFVTPNYQHLQLIARDLGRGEEVSNVC